MADITVVGLVEGTHVLEDIGYDVPKGVIVTIPAELAYRSKDLWRALSQRCVFQLSSGSSPRQHPPTPKVTDNELEALRSQNLTLQAQVSQLSQENERLRIKIEEQAASKAKLDEILALVRTRPTTSVVRNIETVKATTVDDGPLFIPETIRPKDLGEQNLSIHKEESTNKSLSDASDKLKNFRKKQ